jgi:DNA-binding transcriptional LysR family regulator
MLDRLDLIHLRYFQAVVRCGSLTAAAKQLNISQPALSGSIHKLEKSFGTTLLLRSPRGVSPTASGQELLTLADSMLHLLERAEQRIWGLESDDVGSFTIGCHESLGAYFLPNFMTRFFHDAPRIEITLLNRSSRQVQEAVIAQEVHFGIVVNPDPHPDLVITPIFHDAVTLFISTDRAPPDEPIDLAMKRLQEGPLVFAGRVTQSQQLIRLITDQDLLPTRLLSCGDLELVKSFALAGLGVALLPERVARYNQPGRLRRLHPDLPLIPDTICLLYRADIHRTRAAMRLKDALVAYGRTLDASHSTIP